jgi:aspartate/methionine/tyrosine aminotransferase
LTEADRISGIELSVIRQIMQAATPGAINMALGELGFELPNVLRKHAIELLRTHTPVYTPNAGLIELREQIAAYYGEPITPDQVCVTNGAEEAIYTVLTAILNPGDVVAIPDPDYSAYPTIVQMMGADTIRLPYLPDLSAPDRDKWEELLSPGVKAIVLSNPKNPTGAFLQSTDLDWLINLCDTHGIILIVDEIYRELYFEERPLTCSGRYERLFIISGLSKSHCMSGWRIGWIISPQSFTNSIIKTRQYISTCSHWLSQKLAVFALTEPGMTAVKDIRAQLTNCRTICKSTLSHHYNTSRLFFPEASPYVMFDTGTNSLQIAKDLAQNGLICVPGSAFGSVCADWLRFNIAIPTAELDRALTIVTQID